METGGRDTLSGRKDVTCRISSPICASTSGTSSRYDKTEPSLPQYFTSSLELDIQETAPQPANMTTTFRSSEPQ